MASHSSTEALEEVAVSYQKQGNLATPPCSDSPGPGGETEALCREIATLRPGLPRFTLDDPANAKLVALEFEPVTADAAGVAAVRRA